ncbi:TPA: fibronectin type III domain-containing protein [Vibrio parahaemolyticus]|uniref:fibronectin type III domain-containing protein n=1 Tax=Vibrio parahaemolyticus TaxID=670 RepID=UPI001375C7E6|nr:fibronectin type III domain-containing protein [Vibrio parahaemolyticus]MCF9822519.1 fibronectin type III domain-containing protein [Vibrio parahaemolyticus]NCN81581.1 fibronectin type III domain-containing protein [Vibrio parahaemolyticus]HCH6248266.1 fibronectin type III domain-containing protein [Vibrio parahaemolyticus]
MGLAAATVAWISVAISVGATIYTMTQMPDNKSNDSIAGTKVTKNGTQSPRNRVYGTAIVGCTYVYSNVLDRDQSYRLDVFSVGGVGAVRFHNVWIDDVKMFSENKNDLTDPANASSGIYDSSSMRPRYKKSDGFKMQWRSGQENQVAAKLAIDNSDGEWTVNHRGACVPHIVIYADYSTDQDYVFFSDRYNINALVTGAEVFDPRTGQVNGESSNTALATLDFLMNDYYGMGVTVDYIDMESFKYGATFCEANDLRINSAIDASAKFADILQDMLACCGGALAIVDGKITFLVEEKVLAPVYELDEDSILKNSLKVSPADSGSYYNVVSTTFKSEINRDNDDDFVIPQNAASDPRVMADGKIITKSLKMPYARDAYEAEDGVVQHCVKYMTNLVYNKAKFQMSCSFDIDLHEFSELRPWDVIGVSSEIYGFKNKLFRVQSMKVATDADRFNIATIHCIEYDHSVYEGTVEGTGSLPRPKPDDNVPAPKNVMFTLSSFVNTGYGLLAWEASCFTPSTAYDIEYKLSSASQWTRLTSAFRGTQFTLTDLKEARYDFRVRTYELFLGSSDWTTITNINVRPAYVIPEVTGLKVETSTPNFKFTWDDMTNVEVDNIPSSDAPNSAGSTGKLADVFHQYSIQIVVNGVMKYATTTKESTFTLDLEKNKEMMGGQPSRVITFRISIEDRLGNSSLVAELVANNRQIGVAGDVDVTNANGSATVEWSPCFEPDFAGTEVHISTTKGFTPSTSTLHATLGKESFYVFPFPDKTTRYMRIAHFDTMGRDGLQYSPEITLTYDGVESAKSVRLISDSQTFHVNKSGVAAPSLIIMSAFTQNVEGSVTWAASPSVALATTSNPNERILKYASMGNHDSVKVTVTVDGVTDTVTICKVRDGHDGQDGQDGSNGQDGNTIYEEYRYGQVINPDASWTAWGADMRTSDIYRQTRRVINDVPQAAGRVHRIAGMDGSNGADGERLFVVYHKNPVNQRPMPPEGAGNTGGWTEDSNGANWMSQKLANTIDQPLTFWSFPIQMKGNDGEVDYSHVDEIAEAKKNEAIEASIASATASVEAAEVRAKAYADGVATDAEKAAIAAADAKANAAETKAKAYADGVVSEAEQAAIAEAERLAAQAEANAKAASDPKGTAAAAQSAAEAYAKARAEAALGIQFTHSGYIERDGLNFRKKSNNNVWDGWASSKQTFTGGCSVTFTAGTTNVGAMCGITTPNMGGASYTDIDFCFYLRGSGVLGIYENGTNRGDFGNYAVGTILTIRYDGLKVRYYVNGVLKREVGTSAGLGFVADMSIYNVSTAFPIQGLTFTDAEGSAALAKAAEDAAKAAAQQNLDSRIPQANADALKTMMSNEGLRYYRKITVGGEANKYYPVIIHGGSQDKLRTVKIWRSYAETAPNSWHNSTHKGALMLTWQGNFGGWGGATYRSTILEHSEAYTTIFADCYIVNHSMGFAFFLRGGGAVYHIASDMDIAGVERTNPSGGGSGIYLDGTLNSFVHATSPYNAPDALTAVNSTRINDLKTAYNGKGQYIKNLNADNITAGKIAAQYVHADVYNGTLVNATNIKAGMLDADHINTRTFTGENAIFDAEVYGGVLTGAVVRTGSTGARAEMREDGYKFAAYNAQNKPTFYVDANGNVVMNSGSISSDVLSEASRNSNIVTWIGTAGKGGNMQFTDNLALVNDVTYFPITNNYYTTGKNGTLNVQYCAANGYLFQDEKSAVGAAAPAQKTLPADAAPTVYFVDASNTTKGAVIRMTIKYTTQAANGTAPSKTNPSGTQGWRKTYAHFHIDNIATRPNVAAGTNVKGYKLCINLGASSIKAALKALNRVPDVISYSEVAEGGRYLPHSYKLVWSGAANSVTNSWGSGWYMVQGHDRGDWHDAGFIFVLDENHYGSAAPRSIFPAYSIYYEYRYDTKIFKSSSGNITRIFKLTGV